MQACTVPYTLLALILGIRDQKIIIDENFTRLYDMTRIRTVREKHDKFNHKNYIAQYRAFTTAL